MLQAKLYAASTPHPDMNKVLSISSAKRVVTAEQLKRNVVERKTKQYEVRLTRDELPLTVQYDDKTYILVLTKSNKLLLQKPLA